MQAYRTYKTAKKHAAGKPVLKVGDLYIVGIERLTSIDLIREDGTHTATITASKLDKLGNGNWAEPKRPIEWNSFE